MFSVHFSVILFPSWLLCLKSLFYLFIFSANRYSPSKKVRNCIVPMKSSSQELLSPQREERTEDRAERLVAARSLASLDGQSEQNHYNQFIPLVGLFIMTSSDRLLKLLCKVIFRLFIHRTFQQQKTVDPIWH